jgi:hypothetical protein
MKSALGNMYLAHSPGADLPDNPEKEFIEAMSNGGSNLYCIHSYCKTYGFTLDQGELLNFIIYKTIAHFPKSVENNVTSFTVNDVEKHYNDEGLDLEMELMTIGALYEDGSFNRILYDLELIEENKLGDCIKFVKLKMRGLYFIGSMNEILKSAGPNYFELY